MRSETTTVPNSSDIRIAILVSTYHHEITNNLSEGAVSAFLHAGGQQSNFSIIQVAGAWELPILAKIIATKSNYDGIIALGCIITGETTHDEIIGHAIARGLMTIALDWGKPVSMGVLTCQTIEQAQARAGGDCGNKGIEAMHAAIQTITTLREQHAN